MGTQGGVNWQRLPKEMGLAAGIHFETSLIDAYAGGVGVMESVPHLDSEAKECDIEAICHHMLLVCGTSTCHMAISRSKLIHSRGQGTVLVWYTSGTYVQHLSHGIWIIMCCLKFDRLKNHC
nr:FGGY carbohydrate kinase domain-containing protein-like isoform X1 [Quercus suber]